MLTGSATNSSWERFLNPSAKRPQKKGAILKCLHQVTEFIGHLSMKTFQLMAYLELYILRYYSGSPTTALPLTGE